MSDGHHTANYNAGRRTADAWHADSGIRCPGEASAVALSRAETVITAGARSYLLGVGDQLAIDRLEVAA